MMIILILLSIVYAILCGVVCCMVLNAIILFFIPVKNYGLPTYKNTPPPPPAKPLCKHAWRGMSYDIDYDVYQCEHCKEIKEVPFVQRSK